MESVTDGVMPELRTRRPARRAAVTRPLQQQVTWDLFLVGAEDASLGEQVASPRDERLDGLRGLAGDFLDRVGHAVIPIFAV